MSFVGSSTVSQSLQRTFYFVEPPLDAFPADRHNAFQVQMMVWDKQRNGIKAPMIGYK